MIVDIHELVRFPMYKLNMANRLETRCYHVPCAMYSVAASTRISDVNLADTMIGKAVEHMFETEDGTKDEWRGMVLARAPIMNTWFFITYEKDPVLYMYQLLDDYKEGDLRIMPDSS